MVGAEADDAEGKALSASAADKDRLLSLDVLRGVAVMGILLLNIVSFAMPEAAYVNPRAYGGWHGADVAVWLVNFVLFDGKMRGLFSFLFGASMLLVIERAEASGRSAAAVHFARMGWLFAIGIAHMVFVWGGDILTQYALIGMAAYALRTLPTERMLVLGGLLVVLSTVLLAIFPLMAHQLQLPAESAAEAAQNARELATLRRGMGVPAPADLQHELTLFRGGYLTILDARLQQSSLVTALVFFGPETLAYMLFGMAGLRSGMLRGEWAPARYRRWLLTCWAIALPVYLAAAAYIARAEFSLFSVALGAFAMPTPVRPVMVAGWACLILLLSRERGKLTRRIAAAGRMAFTNYLLTSLICTTLFYGYGLGWFGHLSRWQLYPVVAAICAAMLLWSKPWLARFRFGPFEWIWRSLARGSVQPLHLRTNP